MHLNPFGAIAAEEWKNTLAIRENISLGEYIIMPNHLHGIISINYKLNEKGKENLGKFISPSNTIGAIIRGFKGASTKRINNIIRELKENSSNGGTGVLQYAPFAPADSSSENLFSKRTGVLKYAPADLPGKGSIWQRNYYESIIRNEQAYRNITNYIKNNPANWKKDKIK